MSGERTGCKVVEGKKTLLDKYYKLAFFFFFFPFKDLSEHVSTLTRVYVLESDIKYSRHLIMVHNSVR